MAYLLIWMSLIACVPLIYAEYADVRCKCVCPKEKGSNISNIHIQNVESDQCTCEHLTGRDENYCLKCQCLYEARNTLLIKTIVILVLVGIASLLIYLVCLMIYEQRNPVSLSVTSDQLQAQLKEPAVRRSRGIRVADIDKKVNKWQHKVSEQRANVFRSHTMLN